MRMYAYVGRDTQAHTPISEWFPRSTDGGLEWLLPTPSQKEPPLKQTSQNDSAEWQICKDSSQAATWKEKGSFTVYL